MVVGDPVIVSHPTNERIPTQTNTRTHTPPQPPSQQLRRARIALTKTKQSAAERAGRVGPLFSSNKPHRTLSDTPRQTKSNHLDSIFANISYRADGSLEYGGELLCAALLHPRGQALLKAGGLCVMSGDDQHGALMLKRTLRVGVTMLQQQQPRKAFAEAYQVLNTLIAHDPADWEAPRVAVEEEGGGEGEGEGDGDEEDDEEGREMGEGVGRETGPKPGLTPRQYRNWLHVNLGIGFQALQRGEDRRMEMGRLLRTVDGPAPSTLVDAHLAMERAQHKNAFAVKFPKVCIDRRNHGGGLGVLFCFSPSAFYFYFIFGLL